MSAANRAARTASDCSLLEEKEMTTIVECAPPNSVILLMDHKTGVIPESFGGHLVASMPTCLAIGTLSEYDGSTRIEFLDSSAPIPSGILIFAGTIYVPSCKLSLCTVLNEELFQRQTLSSDFAIKVWVNDSSEPDKIYVQGEFASVLPSSS